MTPVPSLDITSDPTVPQIPPGNNPQIPQENIVTKVARYACGNCFKLPTLERYKVCRGCKILYYCSKKCARIDRIRHKQFCTDQNDERYQEDFMNKERELLYKRVVKAYKTHYVYHPTFEQTEEIMLMLREKPHYHLFLREECIGAMAVNDLTRLSQMVTLYAAAKIYEKARVLGLLF